MHSFMTTMTSNLYKRLTSDFIEPSTEVLSKSSSDLSQNGNIHNTQVRVLIAVDLRLGKKKRKTKYYLNNIYRQRIYNIMNLIYCAIRPHIHCIH